MGAYLRWALICKDGLLGGGLFKDLWCCSQEKCDVDDENLW